MTTSTQRPQFAALKDLTAGDTADLAKTFQNLASMLEDAGFDVAIEYQIGDGEHYQAFSVRVSEGKSAVSDAVLADARLRVFMSEQTWREMASGTLAPADAFCDGKLRVQGDTKLGVMMLKHLAGTPGQIGIC
jgi:putative sterol carrier protein